MTGAPPAPDDLRAEGFRLVPPHELESAAGSERDAVPGREPSVLGLAEQDADLIRVGGLRVNGEAQGDGEALLNEPPPGLAPLDHAQGALPAFVTQLSPALPRLDDQPVFEEEAVNAVEERTLALGVADAPLDRRQRVRVMRAQLFAQGRLIVEVEQVFQT